MRRRARVSAPVQAVALRGRFAGADVNVRRDKLTWTGKLRPSPLSREYTVRVTYRVGEFPRVKTIPPLESRPSEPLPHFYREGLLCLHRTQDWSPDMLIADTIVPWASEWLIHYEIWLATGEWRGGGEALTAD